jgi:hypothetical protein
MEVEKMTLDKFWHRIAVSISGKCGACPVNEYARETNTERMCDKVYDCADGLMMLHKMLESEERQKMDIGLTAAKEKVRTEFP